MLAVTAIVAGCGGSTTTKTVTVSAAGDQSLLPTRATAAAPPPHTPHVQVFATAHQRALQASHADASPTDLSTTPASTQGWLQLKLGSWNYSVPPDHSWATTAATPNGIDITSTDTSHFGIGFVTNEVAGYSVSQVVALVFQYGWEDTGISQYEVTATDGPFAGPAGTQEEIASWSGTRTDGTAATGVVEVEVSPTAFIVYELDGPSSTWASDLPIMLAIKANCAYLPSEQPDTVLRRG
jgi:hypothetical protein